MAHVTTKAFPLVLAAAGLLLLPAATFAAVTEGDRVGSSEGEIRSALQAAGYEVKEIEVEDSEIEVDVTLNGKEFEIEIDAETGKIVEIEADDD